LSDYTRGTDAHELIERCVRLDSTAWEELVATHRTVVLRVLVGILGTKDPQAIQDLEQETYERLLHRNCEALRAMKSPSHLRGLLRTIAANLARDHLRRAAVRKAYLQTLTPQVEDPSQSPDEILRRKRDVERVFAALETILTGPRASRDAQVFRAFYLEGGSAAEIAAMNLGLSAKGVETVLFRLVRKLRKYLSRDGSGRLAHGAG
jgi:RNA polymerase sigma factor (sigma-70 family)